MPLTRATNLRIERVGLWFFKEYRVHAAPGVSFRVPARRLDAEEATLVGEHAGRALWHVEGEWYWDSEGLDAEQVALAAWDRARRREARFDRLRKLRAREAELASARRERIPREVQLFVWERDAGRCVGCGVEEDLQFDHVIPVARGGGNTPENLQVLCGACNRSKGDTVG